MLSFSPVVGIGTPPTPHPQAIVLPPPLVQGGYTLAWEMRWEAGPNSDEGPDTVVLIASRYVCTLWMWASLEILTLTWYMRHYKALATIFCRELHVGMPLPPPPPASCC